MVDIEPENRFFFAQTSFPILTKPRNASGNGRRASAKAGALDRRNELDEEIYKRGAELNSVLNKGRPIFDRRPFNPSGEPRDERDRKDQP